MNCGRQPGGDKVDKLGLCPAPLDPTYDGFNQGKSAGRSCWLVSGTFCSGKIQGSFADKKNSCKNCAFYKKIHAEEGITELTMGTVSFFAITHTGLVRKSNEDRYLIKKLKDNSVLIAVADGLGGEVAGDYAAEILRGKLAGLNHIQKGEEQPELNRLVRQIDRTIYGEGQKNQSLEGMGSTLVAVLLRGQTAHWVHVGDSRLYIMRSGSLTRVTEDQTLARFLLEEGEITADQFPTHYSRHVMDQCVGCGHAEPETGRLPLLSGDLIVLTTDGVHKQVPETVFNSILNTDTNPQTKAKALIKAALDAGGNDNMTVVIAEG